MEPNPWKCEVCQRGFTAKSAWVRHCNRCPRTAPRRSRQKACRHCVETRARCDLVRPSCARCASRNVLCEYPLQAADGPQSQQHQQPGANARNDAARMEAAAALVITPESLGDNRESRHGPASMDGRYQDGPPQYIHDMNRNEYASLEDVGDEPDETEPVLDPVDAIQDRWALPLLDIAPSSKIARHSMEFLFRVLRTYPTMMARDGLLPPVVHHSQMRPEAIRQPLANAHALAKMWDAALDGKAASLIEDTIGQEMTRLLDEYYTYDEADLLAAMQALLLYGIMLFFLPAPQEKRKHPIVNTASLAPMLQVAHRLAKMGLTMAEGTRKTSPGWEEWVVVTSRCRTILAFFCLEWALSRYSDSPAFHCDEIGFILAPTSKSLWLARTRADWDKDYSTWLLQWRARGLFRMEEVMGLAPGVYISDRAEAWLAETDEFGMMIMALVNAVED